MHSRLEQYMEQLETRLVDLPPAQRQSETEEMRQHIAAMVESRMELGSSEEQAVTETLEQFGQAQIVSRELTRVHTRSRQFLPDNLLTATVCAVVCTYSGTILLCMAVSYLERNGLQLLSMKGNFANARAAFVVGLVVLSCFGVGAMTGTLFPRRAVIGIGATFLIYCAMGLNNISKYSSLPASEVFQVCGIWATLAAITMAGAKAGAQWRKHRQHRKRLVA